MNSTAGITVSGFPELVAKIKDLASDKDKKREILIILRQVAKPTLVAAKANVPVSSKKHIARGKVIESENLRRSLGLITGKSPNPTIFVGPRVKGSNKGWYGHMVEDGHNIYHNPGNGKKTLKSGKRKSVLARVTHKRTGVAAKKVAGVFYLKRAYESTQTTVTADAEKKMVAFVQRRIDKLSR